jgi:hypothetical protein
MVDRGIPPAAAGNVFVDRDLQQTRQLSIAAAAGTCMTSMSCCDSIS